MFDLSFVIKRNYLLATQVFDSASVPEGSHSHEAVV